MLSAVFVPTAFIPGITGRLYQQFAVTIAISVIISAFNALSLSPALAALLLRPKQPSRGPLRRFFDWFNRVFARGTNAYIRFSGALIRKSAVAVVALLLFAAAAVFFGEKLPSGFLPDEDMGYAYVSLQLPVASSLQRTDQAARQVEAVLANTPGVQYTTSVIGFNLLSYVQTSYNAFFFVTLKPWADRKTASRAVPSHQGAAESRAQQDPAGNRLQLFAAGHPGRRHFRRLHVCSRRPRRERHLLSSRERG